RHRYALPDSRPTLPGTDTERHVPAPAAVDQSEYQIGEYVAWASTRNRIFTWVVPSGSRPRAFSCGVASRTWIRESHVLGQAIGAAPAPGTISVWSAVGGSGGRSNRIERVPEEPLYLFHQLIESSLAVRIPMAIQDSSAL